MSLVASLEPKAEALAQLLDAITLPIYNFVPVSAAFVHPTNATLALGVTVEKVSLTEVVAVVAEQVKPVQFTSL